MSPSLIGPDLGLLALIRGLGGLLRRSPAATVKLAYLAQYAVDEIGSVLLAASSDDDLDERLDAIVTGRKIFHINALSLSAWDSNRQAAASSESTVVEFQNELLGLLPATALERFRTGHTLLACRFQAQQDIVRSLDSEQLRHAAEYAAPSCLTSPEIPAEIAQALADGLRCDACLLALACSMLQGRKLTEWLGNALVAQLLGGARSHLRFLAAVPGTTVPLALLPAADRLDLDALAERHALAEHRLATLRRNKT